MATAPASLNLTMPFGLWHVTLPPASSLPVPAMLPAPHPQMTVDEPARAWVTSEDLDGLANDVRDGGAGLGVKQLGIDAALVWPQQGRLLEAWATRLRQAREEFADEPALRALVEAAAGDYLDALADPRPWAEQAWRHHFQPAWAAAIAARVRFRGRRAAMRISREYRVWPVYARGAAMIYTPGRDAATNTRIDLSDTHSRLGRLTVTRRTTVTDDTILAVLLAQSTAQVAAALTAALDVPAAAEPVDAAPTPHDGSTGGDAPTDEASCAAAAGTTADTPTPAEQPAAINDPQAAPAGERCAVAARGRGHGGLRWFTGRGPAQRRAVARRRHRGGTSGADCACRAGRRAGLPAQSRLSTLLEIL